MSSRFSELWQELRGHRTRPIHFDYVPIVLDDEDFDEEPESEAPPTWQAEAVSGRTLVIRYSDAKGATSERQIICRRLDARPDAHYLSAFCCVRKASRSFRVDRILIVVDPATGEVFDPGSIFFAGFGPNAVSISPFHYGLNPRQYADLNAALNVLVFIARCDAEWHPLESEAIERFATSYWLRAEISALLDVDELSRHSARLAPDAEMFWVSLYRCAKHPILAGMMRRQIAEVIAADGLIHEKEQFWGMKAKEFLDLEAQ